MTDVLDERELTVSGRIRHHATVAPMAPAVDFGGRSMTYADLDRIADRIAATLAAMGLAPGDRVLWLGKNNDGFARIVAGVAGVCHGFIGNRMLMPRQVEAMKLLMEIGRAHV